MDKSAACSTPNCLYCIVSSVLPGLPAKPSDAGARFCTVYSITCLSRQILSMAGASAKSFWPDGTPVDR